MSQDKVHRSLETEERYRKVAKSNNAQHEIYGKHTISLDVDERKKYIHITAI